MGSSPRPSQNVVGIYARVSTPKQADATLERQRQRFMEYAGPGDHGYRLGIESPSQRIAGNVPGCRTETNSVASGRIPGSADPLWR